MANGGLRRERETFFEGRPTEGGPLTLTNIPSVAQTRGLRPAAGFEELPAAPERKSVLEMNLEEKQGLRQRVIDEGKRLGAQDAEIGQVLKARGLSDLAPPERKIIKDVGGFQRFADTGKRVFPEAKKELKPKDFETAAKLRKEFTSSAKDFVKVRDSFARVQASSQDPSAAGDMALIFNYMKILDPGSTVREGEFATAEQATGVPQRILNVYNKVLTGERMGDTQRNDFVNRAGKLFTKQSTQHSKRVSEYTRLAKRFDLSPEDIIIDLTDPETLAEAGLTPEEGQKAAEDVASEVSREIEGEPATGKTIVVENPTTGELETWDLTTEKRIK